MSGLFGDVRFGLRMLGKNPGFTAVAVLTLALGIGATTAIFSVVYGVIINPYPYAKSDEIWTPGLQSVSSSQRMRSYRFDEYRKMSELSAFSDVMATTGEDMLLTGDFAPETIRVMSLTANAFNFLGVQPVVGRTFGPGDVRPDGNPEAVAVLTFQLWHYLFGGEPDAVGKTLRLNDKPYTVIGVMPPRFTWWTGDGLWIPLGTGSGIQRNVFPITRLNTGVSAFAAEQQLQQLHLEMQKENASAFPQDEFKTTLTNYLDITVASGEMETSLYLLFVAVGFLLLIACANVANLQLARAASRTREMAVRLSVGAKRRQLIRQLLTESVVMSLAGGVLGLFFSLWITNLMMRLMPSFYVPGEALVEVNGYVLLFSVLVSMLTGVVFGLVPAFQSSRADLVETLKDEARGSSSFAGGKIRTALVISEVALSVMLLVSAGLTVRSFIALQQVDLGFQPEGLMRTRMTLSADRYKTIGERNNFVREFLSRVNNLPGVQAVSAGNGGHPFGGPQSGFSIDGQPEPVSSRITLNLVGSDYLKTFGIPLLRGRMLTGSEIDAAEPVAVINEAAATLFAAGEDPIGKRLHLDLLEEIGDENVLTSPDLSPFVTVVGVIGNVRNNGLRNQTQPAVFFPYTLLAPPGLEIVVRSEGNPMALTTSIRAALGEIDDGLPLARPVLVEEILGDQTVQPRFIMALFSLFAIFGLVLATAGIYSVLSYLVTRRTREIGVRMALGAMQRDVIGMVLYQGIKPAVVGIALGFAGAFTLSRVLTSMLYEVKPADPLTFFSVFLLLACVAVFACLIPARRASKVDPMTALRCE